jgi:hypothetical protein
MKGNSDPGLMTQRRDFNLIFKNPTRASKDIPMAVVSRHERPNASGARQSKKCEQARKRLDTAIGTVTVRQTRISSATLHGTNGGNANVFRTPARRGEPWQKRVDGIWRQYGSLAQPCPHRSE